MFKKECVAATYNERSKTLVLFDKETSKNEEKEMISR